MNIKEYTELYKKLTTYEDIKTLSYEYHINEELLFIIYTQRVTREATRRYYKIKAQVPYLLREWKNGKSLLKISLEIHFPPVLTSYLILLHDNVPRKEFWKWLRTPEDIPNKRLANELKEVSTKDMVYSPIGMELQRKRGKQGEALLFSWLDQHNFEYEIEKELKSKHKKTPDVLFKKDEIINGLSVRWIESKANFGDPVEIKRNYIKQLLPYKKMFGNGIVVYWFDYVEEAANFDGIYIKDSTFFNVNISDFYSKTYHNKENI